MVDSHNGLNASRLVDTVNVASSLQSFACWEVSGVGDGVGGSRDSMANSRQWNRRDDGRQARKEDQVDKLHDNQEVELKMN